VEQNAKPRVNGGLDPQVMEFKMLPRRTATGAASTPCPFAVSCLVRYSGGRFRNRSTAKSVYSLFDFGSSYHHGWP